MVALNEAGVAQTRQIRSRSRSRSRSTPLTPPRMPSPQTSPNTSLRMFPRARSVSESSGTASSSTRFVTISQPSEPPSPPPNQRQQRRPQAQQQATVPPPANAQRRLILPPALPNVTQRRLPVDPRRPYANLTKREHKHLKREMELVHLEKMQVHCFIIWKLVYTT